MDTVGELGRGQHAASLHDPGEGVVGGDLPPDLDWTGAVHTPAVQGIGGQPGPEHDAVRKGIAGGDAKGERRGRGRWTRHRAGRGRRLASAKACRTTRQAQGRQTGGASSEKPSPGRALNQAMLERRAIHQGSSPFWRMAVRGVADPRGVTTDRMVLPSVPYQRARAAVLRRGQAASGRRLPSTAGPTPQGRAAPTAPEHVVNGNYMLS